VKIPEVKLRQPPESQRSTLSEVERRHIRDAARLQRLLSWLLGQLGDEEAVAVPRVSRVSTDTDPDAIAARVRRVMYTDEVELRS